MSELNLPKNYEAKLSDAKWYQYWLKNGFFQANAESKKPSYTIVMPPPNVTGVLHMGHALVNTLQDILIRWKRMSGYEALWVPGTDHAGIATQTVVEQYLIRTENKKRTDYDRHNFLEHVWSWKEKCESRILNQLQSLGCSCDWSKLRFTMDEGNNLAVRTMFKKLFDENLIYRGLYLVNWDPVTQTALADDEVEHEERASFLWYINYPLEDGSGMLTVATTRPETMLGDTAVAVSLKDERYTGFIGKNVRLPLVNRLIPVIADHHVDAAFGTGVVKITPAHDPNDYQIGKRHTLPMINILTADGKINENGGLFEGLTIAAAREAVVQALKTQGLINKIEPHTHRVGISYRSKAVIEPYLSKQWFIKMDGFAKKLKDAVISKKIRLIPETWSSTYFHWIDNLHDWCISRQLWWGHRIPIWYHKDDETKVICFDGEGLPPEVEANKDDWLQDNDVLDTWFSSALWPFSTLGWPNKTPELAKFYPNATLVTGHDILFFWVARMMAFGEYAMAELPFPETFLHGLIYGKSYWRQTDGGGVQYVNEEERLAYDLGKPVPTDVSSKWEKMSKTKGNIIDPLEMIESYGTDAVRMALCASATQARQIDLDRRRFEEFKNFANKIWNGAKFVFMHLQANEANILPALTTEHLIQGLDDNLMMLEDHWILSKLGRTVKEVNAHLGAYEFDLAAIKAYEFFWKEFCAYYLEITKPILYGKVGTLIERCHKQKLLVIVLSQSIRLMHPMVPFITEELFQALITHFNDLSNFSYSKESIDPFSFESLQALQAKSCMVTPYPQLINQNQINEKAENDFQLIEQIIYTIRNIRGEMKLPLGIATDIYLVCNDNQQEWNIIQANHSIVTALIKTTGIHITTKEPELSFASTGAYGNIKVMIPLPTELREQESNRLAKEIEKLTLATAKMETQLQNPEFVDKAPAALIQKQREQLKQTQTELNSLKTKLQLL